MTDETAVPVGIKLIDISENQSKALADHFPSLLADGYGGVIIRATDGLIKDKHYDYFYPAALDAGMVVMVYAAIYANRSGAAQADFLLNTVNKLYDAVGGHLVAWSDGETPDGVSIAVHRAELNKWLTTTSEHLPKVGVYGSIKTWQEFYGNMTLPRQYYFWNAQWRPGSVYTVPIGVTRAQTVFWQNGVWPKHPWIPQPNSVPTVEDVDCNVMPGKSMKDLRVFTGQLDAQVPPPTTHEHPELEAQLLSLDARVKKLESNTLSLQCAMFNPIEDTLAYRLKSFNAKDNEIFDFYPSGSVDDTGKRIHINTPLEVCIEPTYLGDSGFKAYLITDDKFLSANKPSCPIFVDASKGHLQVP